MPNLERLEEQPDESMLAELWVGADAEGFPFEFLPWMLSWGSRVEVLEPENLRVARLEEIRCMEEEAGQPISDGK